MESPTTTPQNRNNDPLAPLNHLNILVTGGSGFLGGAIIKQLKGRECSVQSFSRGHYPHLEAMGVKQIQGDIADKDAVEAACKGMDLVFHTAAKAGVWGAYADYFSANVTGTRHVISACMRQGVSALVHTSSPSVVFDGSDMAGADESAPYPTRFETHYPKTKAMAEQEVVQAAAEGLTAVVLRPHLIWGPEDNHLVPRIIRRANRLRIVGDGQNVVDTIYIDNAAQAHLLAAAALLAKPALSGRIYFISQNDPIRLWEMVNRILQTAGLGPVKRHIPRSVAWGVGVILEFIYHAFNITQEPPMTRFVANELAHTHWFNTNAAKKDLGYTPRISTEKGLACLKEWLAENPLEGMQK